MKLTKAAALGLALVCGLAGTALAGDKGYCDDNCKKSCHPEEKTIKVKKPCWEVDCKDICVPRVKFPWEDCCAPPKCARVRTIKVLKANAKECDKKVWEFKVVHECCDHVPACPPAGCVHGGTVIYDGKPVIIEVPGKLPAEKLPTPPVPADKKTSLQRIDY